MRAHPAKRSGTMTRRSGATAGSIGIVACMAWAAAFAAPDAAAGAYPDRPVRVIVGTPAGSTSDLMLRTLQEAVRAELGQPIVIENRPGADQIHAARQVAEAAADGYTLLAATRTQVAVNPVTYVDPGYDPERDLAPVTLLAYQTMLVAVHPSLPVRTLPELAAWSRAHPDKVNYGSGSASLMLAGEALKAAIGADLTHIPYNGIAPAMNALLAGDVQVGLVDVTSALPSIRAGRVRALVVSGERRYRELPDVPTFAQAGYANADVPLWNALYAPAGTPEAIVLRVREAFVRALASPGVAEKLLGAGLVPATTTPEGLRALAARERADVSALVRRLGIVPH
jgi:tripartite-type tricarboxylate transporter receptor subunit TctC